MFLSVGAWRSGQLEEIAMKKFMSRRMFSALAVVAPAIIAKAGEAVAQGGGVIDARLQERNIVLSKANLRSCRCRQNSNQVGYCAR